MGFKDLDLVKYYTDAYNLSYKEVMDAISEPNPDLHKVKMLIRRCRSDKGAMDLNIALSKIKK
jgi:hypothetical protein